MNRVSGLSSPFLLGFDEIERALERLGKAGDGYPPYNIERVALPDGSHILRIILAVAGFRRDELDVTVEDNQLIIRGRQVEEQARTFLYRGIAARQFQKAFVLADGIEVLGADLSEGLLSIDLARPPAGRPGRKVEIRAPNGAADPK
ncbi:MAG: Hsp20 family protein [Bauldia sp.]